MNLQRESIVESEVQLSFMTVSGRPDTVNIESLNYHRITNERLNQFCTPTKDENDT